MSDSAPVGYYEWLDFNGPMTDETADRLVAELAMAEPATVLDVGCGWAELLLRLLVACPGATGHGIDHDEVLIERADRNAAERGLRSRVSFAPALGAEQPADLVLNVGAEHVFGDLDAALAALWPLVRPGGRLLLGTQFWEQTPTEELIDAIGVLPSLDELIDGVVEVGWRPLRLHVATPQEWDHFEFRFLNDWEQFVMAPDGTPDAANARDRADEHRAGYLRRRGILGFAFLTLGRPQEPPTPR